MRHLPQSGVRSVLPSHRNLPTHGPLRRMALAAAALPLVLGAAACGSDDESGSGDESGDQTSETSATTSDESTATENTSPTDDGGTDSGDDPTDTGAPAALDTMLLTADEMPGVNQETVWADEETAAEDSDGVSDCQKTDLLTIGADGATAREFEDEGQNASAGQVVARFADNKSAWRAHQVVLSWFKTCAQRLDDDVRKVNKPTAVKVPGGQAHVVIAQHGNRNAEEHEFDGIGVVRKGSMLSVVQIDVVSQDYNYEPGQEPAARAVKATAAKMP